MRLLQRAFSCVVLVLMLLVPWLTATAQEGPVEAEWQAAITGQIEAFRLGDGVAALGFAGASFKQAYSDPNAFVAAIANAGYGPIVQSRSHSFGEFNRIGEDAVMQTVKFVGPDQMLYEAVYQMLREPEGWRVQGVLLRQQEGVAI